MADRADTRDEAVNVGSALTRSGTTLLRQSMEPNMRISIITVVWNDTARPEGVDGDEWAYALRMGGIDAEFVHIEEDVPTTETAERLSRIIPTWGELVRSPAPPLTWAELKRRLSEDD